MQYYGLEKLMHLSDGYRKVFKIDAHELMLTQIDGQRFLIEARCPHRGLSLEHASLSASGQLQCPHHHYQFNLRDGRLEAHSEEPCRALRVFNIVYEGNEVGVML